MFIILPFNISVHVYVMQQLIPVLGIIGIIVRIIPNLMKHLIVRAVDVQPVFDILGYFLFFFREDKRSEEAVSH